ncbi:MAG: transposase, partial [Proteobacteria bacterium]|nr:transposase [Pseudomonadota bacterium]
MNDDRHGSHTVFSIHLHVAWMNQYRPKVLPGMVAERVREMVREECRRQQVDILRPSSLRGMLPRTGVPFGLSLL